jgi:hypothetical protein
MAALASGSARADTVTSIPVLSNLQQTVADSTAGYLFLSAYNGGIVVTDLTGAYVATLEQGAGVKGLAVSADGSTLYAAITLGGNADSVAAIDVSTVTNPVPTQNFYPLAATDLPDALAVQSGVLWVSYADSTATNPGAIGDFPLTANVPGTFAPATATSNWAAAPDLAADPSDTGVLVAVLPNTDPTLAATYNTTTVPATTIAAPASLGSATSTCFYESQLAVVPGGAHFLAACTGTASTQVYSTADLSAATPAKYVTTHPAAGAAVDADGTVAVASFNNPGTVDIYKADGTLLNAVALGADALGNSYTLVYPNGLAWLDPPAGPELAVVTQDAAAANESVRVISNPELPRAALTLRGPGSAVHGRAFTLNGTLTMTNGAALPAGGTLSVTRTGPSGPPVVLPAPVVGTTGSFTVSDTPAGTGSYTYAAAYSGVTGAAAAASASTKVTVQVNTAKLTLSGPVTNAIAKTMTIKGGLLFAIGTVPANTKVTITRTAVGTTKKVVTVSTAAGGAFHLTDTLTVAGRYTYTAAYAGTATTTKATASHVVTIVKFTPALSVASNASTFNYGSTVHVTAHLGATYRNRSVSIYAKPYGHSAILVKTGVVNAAGNLTASYAVQQNTTFSAVFTGDARYATRTVYRGVNVRARVGMQLSGYYGTSQQGGQTYLLYHQTGQVDIAVTVAPSKLGGCAELEVEEYFNGAWSASSFTNCAGLNSSGQVSGYLNPSGADLGYPYRVRTDYLASSGVLSNDSSWQYFMIEP